MRCEMMGDLLPGYAAGTLDEATRASVGEHLESCPECRAEMAVVSLLANSDPIRVPDGLEARIQDAVRRAVEQGTSAAGDVVDPDVIPLRPRRAIPAWAMSAAAVLVLALGTPLLMDRMASGGGAEGDSLDTMEDPVATVWTTEDGLIAGAPALDMLSDEELSQLLAELDG